MKYWKRLFKHLRFDIFIFLYYIAAIGAFVVPMIIALFTPYTWVILIAILMGLPLCTYMIALTEKKDD